MRPGTPQHPDWLDAIGSRAHFSIPAAYDGFYAQRTHDIEWYVALAERHGGPILEVGCGNGRITLPMARAGASVTGVDRSPAMVADLKRKVAVEGLDVRVRLGDMRTMRGGRFPLILCTFNTFLHLYTRRDAERFLARVTSMLSPGGRFVFDVSLPPPKELARDPKKWVPLPMMERDGKKWLYSERFAYEDMEQIEYVFMRWTPTEPGLEPIEEAMAHRLWYPAEVEMLLHYNGFRIESTCGFEGDATAEECVYTARRR